MSRGRGIRSIGITRCDPLDSPIGVNGAGAAAGGGGGGGFGAVPPVGAAVAVAVDSYLRHVAIERGLSTNTVAAYRRDLAIYSRWLAAEGLTGLADVTAQHISAYVRFLGSREESPLTAASIARILSTVRGFHRFLLEEGLVETDVAHESKPPKLGTRLPKAISIEQVTRLLAAKCYS